MPERNGADSKESSRQKKKHVRALRTVLRIITGAVFVILAALAGTYSYAASTLGDRIARGVRIGTLELGGRTRDEATRALRDRVANMRLTFVTPIGTTTLTPAEKEKTPFGFFNLENDVAHAYAIGREQNPLLSAVHLLQGTFIGTNISLDVSVDKEALRKELELRFGSKAHPAENAQLFVRIDPATKRASTTIAPEKIGLEIDYDTAAHDAEMHLQTLTDTPITMAVKKDEPKILAADAQLFAAQVAAPLEKAPLTLTVKNQTWSVSKETVADWLAVLPPSAEKNVRLGLDPEKVKNYLTARGAAFSSEPKDAKFEEKDGHVTVFEPGTPGETLDLDAAYALLEKNLFANNDTSAPSPSIALSTIEVPPTITTASVNPYGIKEIIGVGATNFRGSPKNRIHNISVGAASVDNALIAPGEEFSLLKKLGKIDETTGYLQELVIKENHTTPEYGGGLCQIGSTTFRAALASGLPITMRQNHSYRVPYYERDGEGNDIGPGKDATIYDPAPDFRFMNDTGHYMIIKTAMQKNTLTFTFWGVNDGRVATQTKAKISNIVPPPEKKIVPTTDLKPGEEKCTEHAHLGSDAVFTYTVTMPDGKVKTKDFKSHYKPWQEVCLEGVDPSQMPPVIPDGATPGVGSADAAGATGATN